MKNKVLLLISLLFYSFLKDNQIFNSNHNIISLRLGRAFGKKFHLIGSLGIESLSRFASYSYAMLMDPVEFFIDRNKKSTLFNYKIAAFYRFGRLGYEVGLSRRGVGGKIMWYINY